MGAEPALRSPRSPRCVNPRRPPRPGRAAPLRSRRTARRLPAPGRAARRARGERWADSSFLLLSPVPPPQPPACELAGAKRGLGGVARSPPPRSPAGPMIAAAGPRARRGARPPAPQPCHPFVTSSRVSRAPPGAGSFCDFYSCVLPGWAVLSFVSEPSAGPGGVFSTAVGVTNWHSRSPPAGRCLVFKSTRLKGAGELVAPQGDGFCFGFGMSDEHI